MCSCSRTVRSVIMTLDAATSVDSVAVQWLKDLDSSYLNCERSLNRSFVQY